MFFIFIFSAFVFGADPIQVKRDPEGFPWVGSVANFDAAKFNIRDLKSNLEMGKCVAYVPVISHKKISIVTGKIGDEGVTPSCEFRKEVPMGGNLSCNESPIIGRMKDTFATKTKFSGELKQEFPLVSYVDFNYLKEIDPEIVGKDIRKNLSSDIKVNLPLNTLLEACNKSAKKTTCDQSVWTAIGVLKKGEAPNTENKFVKFVQTLPTVGLEIDFGSKGKLTCVNFPSLMPTSSILKFIEETTGMTFISTPAKEPVPYTPRVGAGSGVMAALAQFGIQGTLPFTNPNANVHFSPSPEKGSASGGRN